MSEATKHTPGPWSYEYEPRARMSMIAGREHVVAGIPNETGADRETQHANAKLIAAAPALADALVALVDYEPKENDLCHVGITTMEKCSACRLILDARAALRAAGRLP